MLNLATPSLDMKNSDGSTLLHVAAIVGNTKAAELLVGRNRDLLFAQDNDGQRPLARALSNMHFETSYYLLRKFYKVSDQDTETGNGTSLELLVNVISSKDDNVPNLIYLDTDHRIYIRNVYIKLIK
ncbi:putative ankyrin repeat-containing domain-containing protein [Helianthus anomalus]